MKPASLIGLAVGTALAIAAATPARADCPPAGAAPVPVAARVVRDAAGTRIVIDTPIEVCVRPPAPAVALIAPSPSPAYVWLAMKRDFLPLIVASVRAPLFGGTVAAQPPRPEDPS